MIQKKKRERIRGQRSQQYHLLHCTAVHLTREVHKQGKWVKRASLVVQML